MLYTHVKDVVDGYFKALIAEEEHPIIPREEPKKEEPIVDEEEEDEETVSGLIVETDKTGTGIKKATEVEFITQGNTEDDYLAELRQEVAEFQKEDTTEEEDEDYSTDFDIF
jgi:hypothetical protein